MSTIRWPLGLVAIGLLLSGPAAAPPHQDATPSLPATDVPTLTAITTPAAETAVPFALPTWVSPTPDTTGAIIVIVQPGESMWVIAARAGLGLPELLALNNLTEQSIINPGDALIIGYATPEIAPTAEESPPTATLPPPTPRPTDPIPEAAVCLSAFDDLNRNGIRDTGEPLRSGVAFTIYNTEAVVANYITDGRSEPRCLSGLQPGEYRVTRSVMAGETLTSSGDWSLSLTAGSELYQAFGSVTGPPPTPAAAQLVATPTTPLAGSPAPSPGTSPDDRGLIARLAAVGALFIGGLLLLGAVLILLLRQSRTRPEVSPPNLPEGERRFRNLDDLE